LLETAGLVAVPALCAADNCGSLTDCYPTALAAAAVVAAIVLVVVLPLILQAAAGLAVRSAAWLAARSMLAAEAELLGAANVARVAAAARLSGAARAGAALEAEILQAGLGAESAGVLRIGVGTGRMTTFLRQYPSLAGHSIDDLYPYLRSADFTKPVLNKVLSAGQRIEAWELPGWPAEKFFTNMGTDPKQLGIILDGRVRRVYEVVKPIHALESTVAPYPTNIYPGVGGQGGGLQLMLPPGAKDSLRAILE
jgi:hypothetical protein